VTTGQLYTLADDLGGHIAKLCWSLLHCVGSGSVIDQRVAAGMALRLDEALEQILAARRMLGGEHGKD